MKPTHNSRAVSLSSALAAAALTFSGTASAADYYWDNNDNTAGFGTAGGTWLNPTPGGTTGWSTDSTGVSAIGSVTTATADNLYFGTDANGLATGTVNIGAAAVNVGNIRFGKDNGDITLTGGNIAMAGGTNVIQAATGGGSVSNTVTIDNNLSKATGTLQFGTQNTANEKYVMNGVLSGGFGVDGRVTNNTGQLYLNGLNTFTGNFSITTGQYYANTLADIGVASSLGAGSSINMGGGGGQNPRLVYTGSTATSTDRTLTVNANGIVGIIAQDGALDLSGTIRSNSGAKTYNLYLSGTADTGTNEVSGVMQDNGSGKLKVRVANFGASGVSGETGYWVFSGANTYTGNTEIENSSTLVLGNGGSTGSLSTSSNITVAAGSSFIVNQSDTVTQGTHFSNTLTGAGDVTMAGSGTLELSFDNTGHSGDTIVNNGTLRLVNTADLRGMVSDNFHINNGSTLEIESSVGGSNRSTLLNDSIFTFDSNGGGNIDFVSGNHLAQTGTSGNARFVTTGGSQNTITSSGGFINPQGGGNHVRFDVADGGDDVDLSVAVNITNGTWRKDGAGTLSITNNNSQAGGAININAGTFEIGGSGRIKSSGEATGVFANAINNDGVFKHNTTLDQTVSGVIGGTGAVVKDNSGNLTITASNTYSGGTTINGGTVILASGASENALGSGTVTMNSGGSLKLWINPTGSHTIDNAFTMDGGTVYSQDGQYNLTGAMTLNAGGGTLGGTWDNKYLQVSGVISGVGGLTIVDFPSSQTGDVILSGVNTFSGNTTISAGTLTLSAADNNIANSTAIDVASGATLDVSGITNGFELASGQTLSGSGTVAGGMTISLGGVLSPGNSPGTMSTGAQTWENGGTYLWEINDSGGLKGDDPGWDWLDITGTLDLTNLAAGGFTIDIDSLDGLVAGNALGFDSYIKGDGNVDYSFIIATTSSGVTDFNADKFSFESSGFSNGPAWDWQIVLSGSDLVLEAYAVPEPSSTALLGLGGLALMLRRKRS